MPALLSPADLDAALSRLDGWSSDGAALHRSVEFDDGQHAAFAHSVAQTAESMNHHPDISRYGRSTVIALSTHSEGGITALDAALASKIDEAVDVLRTTRDTD